MGAHDGCSYSCDGGGYRGDSTSDDITVVSDECGTCEFEIPPLISTVAAEVVDWKTFYPDNEWPKEVDYYYELLKRMKPDFVLGCTAGRNSMHQKMILLQRPDHTKTGAVSTCTFICTFILLSHHFKKAEQERWQDDSVYRTVLNARVIRSFFNGAPSKWTFDDQPVFSDTRLLLNYNIPNTEKCIQPKGETNVDIAPPDSKDIFTHIWNKNITQFVTDPVLERTTQLDGFDTKSVFVTWGLSDALKCIFKDLVFNGCKLQLTKINIEKFSAMWHSAKRIEGLESDTLDTGENWTEDSIQLESTSDEECPDRNKLLPSKTASEDDDGELLRIENEVWFGSEQITRFTEMNGRLETYIAMSLSYIDCELFADAGFVFTGDSFVCFSCYFCIGNSPLEDPWMEHTFNSPGCAYVRYKKGQDYIRHVLTQSTEVFQGKDGKHSNNHPDDAKSQKDLLVEKKNCDQPDLVTRKYITVSNAGSVQGGTGDYSVQKHSCFGRLKLFDHTEGGKKLTISLETPKKHSVIVKGLLKYLYDSTINEPKEVHTYRVPREPKETSELIRHLRELSCDTQKEIHIHLYMVQDVMSLLSSYNIWPHRNIRTGPLVEAGFSCKDPKTSTVECKSCGLELNASTLNGTTPMQYHREHSPDCEFFRQTNSQGFDGQRNRALTDSSHNQAPSPMGVNQEAAHSPVQQPPGNNQQRKPNQGQAQAEKTSEANDTSARTRSGNNDGNIRIDEATSPTNRRQTENASSLFSNNGAASIDSIVAERTRTGEVFDRATLIVPNNNNVTSSGEAVRENENIIAGAQGGEVPYPIRNPRFTEQNARRESYTHWPHRAAHDLDYLVNAGFFYTGAEDIVRCFYCDIGLAEWNPDDDPWVEHARHSPECPYLRDQKGQDYINNIQAQWARIYTPKHPQYAQMDTRRRSYQNAGWPRDNVLQTPEQLAASGFFYTGDGDTVRCHYCDGGLREWEPEDDPWVEHARWFPFCKFVLKIKGIDFIQASATGNPANGLQAPVAPPAAPRINEPPLTLSFVDKCRIKEQKNPMHSAAAQSMRTMGYSRGTIRMVIDKFLVLTGRRDFKAVDLMDIIMAEEEAGRTFPESDGEDDGEETGATAGGAAAGGINAIDLDEEMDFSPAAMRKENEYLKQKFKYLAVILDDDDCWFSLRTYPATSMFHADYLQIYILVR
ncbi:uncharacterized protein LOC110458047 isoform X2 [Mizuhopecten yessoensis]|uniref:uncharacterized protein LOC110458047 isoform X2 n=1 Tax=Mizuhopecten yessoensis TaxID=6573 RepID=UPI000B45843D|nr:uncharacterized protein LOC110458047 isoform X2 [Mizuhopecten yessoensis]